jgi:hypothetical protein
MGKHKTPIPKTTLGTRLYFVIPGLSMIAFSIAAVSRGVWWIPGFSETFGRARITPALTFGGLGLIFLPIGLIPWNQLDRYQK